MKTRAARWRAALGAVLALAAFCAAAGTLLAAEPPKVSAHLEPNLIGKDEMATFTIVVESSGFGTPDLEPEFRLENLQQAGGPFRSTSQSWVNGVTSSSTQLVWRLRPLGVGTASVRAVRVTVEGTLVQLPDATIEIVEEAPQRAAPQRRGPPDPFGSLFGDDPFGRYDRRRPRLPTAEPKLKARAMAEPASVWVGEQLVWRLLLDTQTDISRVEPRELPDFRGFWVQDITPDQTPAPKWIEIDGEKFARVPVIERALFPLEPGAKQIEPVRLDVLAQFFDTEFFGRLPDTRPVPLTAGAVTVTVKPLPPAPAGFAGVVGELDLTAKLDRTELDAGQAASLTLRAASDGNLQSVEPPTLVLPDGVRAFSPTRESEEKVVGGRLQSAVRWRYVLLADRAGRFELPELAMTYFDPQSGSYREARTAPLALAVKGVAVATPAAPAPEAPAPKEEAKPVARDWLSGRALRVAGLALTGLALAVGIAAVGSRRRRAGQPAQALRLAIQASAAEGSARAAAAKLEEAWRTYLADRWSIPRSLAAAQWGPKLSSQGIGAEFARELATLFEELHFLAYAPELADVDAHRSEIVERSKRLLRRLG